MPHRVPPADDQSTQSAQSCDHFRCDVRFSGRSAAWIHIRGRFDGSCADRVAEAVERAFAGALLAIVDLRRLESIDRSGLRVLLDADARARRSGRRLVLVRGAEQTDRLLLLSEARDQLRIIDLRPVLAASQVTSGIEPGPRAPDAA